jgi:hypothetical protein
MLLLCRIIITGTDIYTGTNGKDVACAGRNYVTSPSGFIALVLWYNLFITIFYTHHNYCGVCKPVE